MCVCVKVRSHARVAGGPGEPRPSIALCLTKRWGQKHACAHAVRAPSLNAALNPGPQPSTRLGQARMGATASAWHKGTGSAAKGARNRQRRQKAPPSLSERGECERGERKGLSLRPESESFASCAPRVAIGGACLEEGGVDRGWGRDAVGARCSQPTRPHPPNPANPWFGSAAGSAPSRIKAAGLRALLS